MSGLETGSQRNDWYVVAGFRGEEPTKENTDFVVVQASEMSAALEVARGQSEGFNPVTALSERELWSFIDRIERQKAAKKS